METLTKQIINKAIELDENVNRFNEKGVWIANTRAKKNLREIKKLLSEQRNVLPKKKA